MSNNKLELHATDAQVRALYKSATPELRAILEESKKDIPGFFSTNILDRVKSLSGALSEVGETIESFNERTKGYSLDNLGNEELKTWAKALNEGWEADYKDRNQRKYYPVFDTVLDSSKRSGVGLSLRLVGYGNYSVVVGSRHHFKSEALVKHAVKYGMSSYEKHIIAQ